MKKNYLFITVLTIIIILLLYGLFATDTNKVHQTASLSNCVPTFPDGDGPYYYPNSPFRDTLVPDDTKGEKLVVKGIVWSRDCKTKVGDVVLDIWQANHNGKYEKEWYRGQVKVDSRGNFRFKTVMPKGYGEGTGYRPPHIHFKVWDGKRLIITSEMFFSEVKGTPGFQDEFIMNLEKKNKWGKTEYQGYHNIILPE